MLENSRQNIYNYDTRAAVLNCATSIEVVLKKRISDFLSKSSTSPVKDYVLKQADSYSKQVEMCKKFGIPLNGVSNAKKFVFDVRNRVAHGGYIPSFEEANKAYKSTRSALIELAVPMFE